MWNKIVEDLSGKWERIQSHQAEQLDMVCAFKRELDDALQLLHVDNAKYDSLDNRVIELEVALSSAYKRIKTPQVAA